MDDLKREIDRAASTGDPAAQARQRHMRCRTGECCAHKEVTLKKVSGCSTCPLAGFHVNEDEPYCGASSKLTPPTDADGELIDAIPSACPLWDGTIAVALSRMVEG